MSSLCEELQAGRPSGSTAVTFGVFDGVHLGHLHVLDQLRASAAAAGLTPVVVTIANHPLSVLRPEVPLVMLTSLHERLDLLRASGIEHVIPITFTREVSVLTPEQFMRCMAECVPTSELELHVKLDASTCRPLRHSPCTEEHG